MTSIKQYLRYHAKSRIGYVITTSLLGFLITLIALLDESGGKINDHVNSLFYMPAIVITVVAVLSAVLEFAPFMNRRNLDAMYSLPIGRRGMYFVHYLTGFVSTLIAHCVSFWLVFFFWLPHKEFFSLGYAVPLYFISLVCGFIMYAIAVFLFTQGNTVTDGCLTLALGGFSLSVFTAALESLFDLFQTLGDVFIYDSTFFWSPINNFTTAFQDLIEQEESLSSFRPSTISLAHFFSQTETVTMIVLFLALGVAATVGFFLTYHKKRVETFGEITTSWFSYRTMIPLYGFSLLALLRYSLFWLALILPCMVIGYVIYRRTYRLKHSDVIVLAVFVGYGLVLLSQ